MPTLEDDARDDRFPPDNAALKRRLMALAREIGADAVPGTSSDHDWPHEMAPKD